MQYKLVFNVKLVYLYNEIVKETEISNILFPI
jgi:hypothetical protein